MLKLKDDFFTFLGNYFNQHKKQRRVATIDKVYAKVRKGGWVILTPAESKSLKTNMHVWIRW